MVKNKEKYGVLENKNINIYLDHCTLFFKTDYKENKDIYDFCLNQEYINDLIKNILSKIRKVNKKLVGIIKLCAFGCEITEFTLCK